MTTKPFAVVTGASSGIGFELARQFVEHDFDVLITAEEDELAAAAARLSEKGRTVHAVGPGSYQAVYNASKSFLQPGAVLPDRVKAAMHTVMARPRRRPA